MSWNSSLSKIREEALTQNVRVVTAAGEDLPILYHVTARVKLNMVDRVHDFLVVENLVAAAILGVDFLRQQGLLLDFRTTPVAVLPPPNAESRTQSYSMDDGHSNLEKIWARQAKKRDQACSVADITDPDTNIVDECTIPAFGDHTGIEAPAYVRPCFNSVVKEFNDLTLHSSGCDQGSLPPITSTQWDHQHAFLLGEYQFTSRKRWNTR